MLGKSGPDNCVQFQQLISQYEILVGNLRRRGEVVQKTFLGLEDRLGRHYHQINATCTDVDQLHEEHVVLVAKVVGMEDKVCHCGNQSKCLSDLSYGKLQVMSGVSSSTSFHSGASSRPIPVPLPTSSILPSNIPIPALPLSPSNKENITLGSEQSASVVTELIPVLEGQEVKVQYLQVDEEVEMASDFLDHQVCVQLGQ